MCGTFAAIFAGFSRCPQGARVPNCKVSSYLYITFAALLGLGACSLNVGAGAQGSLGRQRQPVPQYAGCNGFDSCERLYENALARADRCHETSVSCDEEDRQAAVNYAVLHDQTERELTSLREMARDARNDADAARAQRAECTKQ